MATVVAAVKGQMGSTPYYMAKIKAREFTAATKPASDLDEWAGFSIEERMQRELNLTRVTNEIVPYLVRSADRFFGAFVVLIYKGQVYFEPLAELGAKVPQAYKSVASDIGFLTIDGGELIVLDGQHRHAALKDAITSDKVTGDYKPDVAGDELEVIFISFDHEHEDESTKKVRRIFNKLNRYARPTGRGDNIITSEDDGYAIVTRMLLRTGEPLGVTVTEKKGGQEEKNLIVNWKSNTISDRSLRFTTVSAVYETVKVILDHYGVSREDFDEKKHVTRPSDEDIDLAYEHVNEWWDAVLAGIDLFKTVFENPGQLPKLREDGQPNRLLLKPAAHIVLFMALSLAVNRGVDLHEAVGRLNKIDWDIEADQWKDVLIQPNGRISARAENYKVTAEMVAYQISADRMSQQEIEQVAKSVGEYRQGKPLPAPVA